MALGDIEEELALAEAELVSLRNDVRKFVKAPSTLYCLTRSLRFYGEVLQESIATFFGEGMLTHTAALSYYMIFSLPSMLLIILWGASMFYGELATRG